MSTRLTVGDTVRTNFAGREVLGRIVTRLDLEDLFLVQVDLGHGSPMPAVCEARHLQLAAPQPAL